MQRPFRVAMVCAGEWPSPRGSQALLSGVSEALASRGHQLHLVSHGGLAPVSQDSSAVQIHRPRRLGWPAWAGLGRIVDDGCLALALYSVVRRWRVDVIHAHNYEGAGAALWVRALTGVPVVYHAHNVLSDELPYYVGRRVKALARVMAAAVDRILPRMADHTLALTDDVAEHLGGCGVSPERLSVVPPVVPTWRAAESGDGSPVDGEKFRVAYAGNLDGYQGLDVLAAAVEQLGEGAELLVITHSDEIGSGRAEATLGRLRAAGRVRVEQAADAGELASWIRSADVLVCPRPSWSGFPIKLLNYFAAGRPMVCARSAAKWIIDGYNGLVVEPGQPAQFAAAIARLRRDAGLRRRLSIGAIETANTFPEKSAVAVRLERVYAQVVAGAGLPITA